MGSATHPGGEHAMVTAALLRVVQASPDGSPPDGWDLAADPLLQAFLDGRPEAQRTVEEWEAIFISKIYPPRLVPEVTARVQQARVAAEQPSATQAAMVWLAS